ncbi:hypothetical protein M9H77_08621 [Catharanthus roseus]|uniref:Uncharacterized protein n=1 Tax=Catharanthus roseus TaxID=4058 RepID=A0ACC0BYB2_CATRO|nr:hypothetical protein M9H77_08621 [Catharanthus roseus]
MTKLCCLFVWHVCLRNMQTRNVRLGLCMDGFLPFRMVGNTYSSWPVIVTPYNLPPWMYMKKEVLLKKLRRAQDTLSIGFSFTQEIGVRREKLINNGTPGQQDPLSAAGPPYTDTGTGQFRCSRFIFRTGHTDTGTRQFHGSRFIFRTDHTTVIIYGSFYRSCGLEAALQLYSSLRVATHISTILQEQFTNPYHRWSKTSSDFRNNWWGEFQKRCVYDPSLSMAKMMHAWEVKQTDLTKRFSKSRHLEELHKHQNEDKKGYRGLHGASSEAAHLRAESSRAAAELPPYCLEAERRIMRRVEVAVSSICAAFDEHMRRFAEQSHLPYTSMLPIMDIMRAAMAAIPSISLSTTTVVGTSDAARVSFSTPPPFY